jgi:hypothetical protein
MDQIEGDGHVNGFSPRMAVDCVVRSEFWGEDDDSGEVRAQVRSGEEIDEGVVGGFVSKKRGRGNGEGGVPAMAQ